MWILWLFTSNIHWTSYSVSTILSFWTWDRQTGLWDSRLRTWRGSTDLYRECYEGKGQSKEKKEGKFKRRYHNQVDDFWWKPGPLSPVLPNNKEGSYKDFVLKERWKGGDRVNQLGRLTLNKTKGETFVLVNVCRKKGRELRLLPPSPDQTVLSVGIPVSSLLSGTHESSQTRSHRLRRTLRPQNPPRDCGRGNGRGKSRERKVTRKETMTEDRTNRGVGRRVVGALEKRRPRRKTPDRKEESGRGTETWEESNEKDRHRTTPTQTQTKNG